jgi:hypothetical protein
MSNPILADCDVVAVKKGENPATSRPAYKLVGEVKRVLARVGNENLESAVSSSMILGHAAPTKCT